MERSELERRLRASVGLPGLHCECPMSRMLREDLQVHNTYRNRWAQVLPMEAGPIELLKARARWYEYLVEASGLPCFG